MANEASRAQSAETTLQANIDAEAATRAAADTANGNAVAAEAARAGTAEAAEVARASAAEAALAARVYTLEQDEPSDLTYDKLVVREVPAGNVDGTNATFTLANTPYVNTESVYLNGVLQNVGASNDYTITGQGVTLNYAPLVGDVILVSYFR